MPPLRLYISYGVVADQVTALRLQALGAVNGLIIYVPPAYTREGATVSLDPKSETSLRDADVILGVISSKASDACWLELNLAKALGKRAILLAEPEVAPILEPHFPGEVLMIDPANPAQAESGLVQFLKSSELEKGAKTALMALGTIALGLLLFAPQD